MRKFLFVLASTGSLATMNAAIAQYPATGYYAPGYYGSWLHGPGYTAPGYRWREQRLNEEQRTSPDGSCMRTTKNKERQITRSGADRLAYQIQMLLVVNAPKAFQRKLVEGADRSTTHQVKTNQPG